MYPAQHGALVVSGAPAIQLAVLLREDPGVRVPPVLHGGGLDVKVTVHQQRLLAGVSPELAHQDGGEGQDGAVRESLRAEVHKLYGSSEALQLLPCPLQDVE